MVLKHSIHILIMFYGFMENVLMLSIRGFL